MNKVFIDGSAGTTGLRIAQRLALRNDIELIKLPEELRKDTSARRQALNEADIAFLCLPDAAAIEAVSLMDESNSRTAVIDTSTAHRTADGWTYGFPEIAGLRDKIPASRRIANPGCHASGFISLTAPLTEAGILNADAVLTCFSLTGYSGGGKNMIAQYEDPDRCELLDAPRTYGLSQQHKHLPEMTLYGGLKNPPVFCPVVAPYYAGMEVVVTLTANDTNAGMEKISRIYREFYGSKGGLITFRESADEGGFLSAGTFAGKDSMEISVFGNDDRITLVSRFDNLGKGASGAAIQNMNLVLGLDETTGLNI